MATEGGIVLELCGRLDIGFLDGGGAGGDRGGLVKGESDLHAFDGAGAGVLVRFPGALLLGGALAGDVGRVVAFGALSSSKDNGWVAWAGRGSVDR